MRPFSTNACRNGLMRTMRSTDTTKVGKEPMRFLVSGAKHTFECIRALVPESVPTSTLRARVNAHYETTWEQLALAGKTALKLHGKKRGRHLGKAIKRAAIYAAENRARKEKGL